MKNLFLHTFLAAALLTGTSLCRQAQAQTLDFGSNSGSSNPSNFEQLAKEGMTMIVVTHEMGFARDVANRIVFMDDGLIVEESSPEEMFRAPKTDRCRSFLESVL